MKKLALIALPLAFGLVACDNAAEDTVAEPVATETEEPMAAETPMAGETPMEETVTEDTMVTETPAPEATETPM